MRALLISLLAVTALAAQAPTTPGLRTMRVDYFHTGDAKQEIFSFDEAVIEPAVWSGRAGREMPDSRAAGTRPQTLKSRRRSLKGEVENSTASSRRESASNFRRSAAV